MKSAFITIKEYSPTNKEITPPASVTVSALSSATKKRVLGDIDPNQPRLLESAGKKPQHETSSPNFRSMEEKTPGGSHRKRRQGGSRDKENEYLPSPDGNQSFGENSKRSSRMMTGLRSKDASGSKTPQGDILAMKLGTFGQEIEEEKERMSPPASNTLSLGTNSPDLYKILEDSEHKIKIFNESSQGKPSRFSMSGGNLKIGSLLESSPSRPRESQDGFELRRSSYSPTKKKIMSSTQDSSKPKVSYLLRNYDIGFRVGDNGDQENNPNKAEYLVAEHGSSYKFISLGERKQLNNPNESMEIFKNNITENHSDKEEYAEPLELEQHKFMMTMREPLRSTNTEGFGLSSVDSYGPGTAQTLSLADTLTPKNLLDLFSPTSMQSPQNLAQSQKDYVYTKFFPKPSNLKETAPVKPKSCLKKPSERGFGAEPRKKSGHNVNFKEDKIHNVSAASQSQTNISVSTTPKSNQATTNSRTKGIADFKTGGSSRSASPIFTPDMLQNMNKKSQKQTRDPKKKVPVPKDIRHKSPPNDLFKASENESMHLSVQDLYSGSKQQKNQGKKELQIQIPTSSDERQGGGLSSNIMSQIEQRLLEEEKYGTLYGMYKDKNPEKANAVLGLYRGALTSKSSAVRNISPVAAAGALSSSRHDLQGSTGTFKSASPTNRMDMKRGGQGFSDRSNLEKSNSSKELLRSGNGFKTMKLL